MIQEPTDPPRDCCECDRLGCHGCGGRRTARTTIGPIAIDATTPAPGLIVFENPGSIAPEAAYPWLLAHHEGHIIAAFETEAAADEAAMQVAQLADWTRSVMTAAQQISLSLDGGARAFLQLLRELGGHDPNARGQGDAS